MSIPVRVDIYFIHQNVQEPSSLLKKEKMENVNPGFTFSIDADLYDKESWIRKLKEIRAMDPKDIDRFCPWIRDFAFIIWHGKEKDIVISYDEIYGD